MRLSSLITFVTLAAGAAPLYSGTYTNFIRQAQVPSGVQWDVQVPNKGSQASALPLDTNGSRFELWSVFDSPLTAWLLDSRFVGAYAPSAEVVILSEDPYPVVPRTRADRPFKVQVQVGGLIAGSGTPEAAGAVKLLRHVQSYGKGGTDAGIDRSDATLLTQSLVTQNGTLSLEYPINGIPAEDLAKTTGEERFSVFTLADGSFGEAQIASRHIQIWPVADGRIEGISMGQKIRYQAPQLIITLNDLYPESQTYTQVYPGDAVLGTEGTIISGTSVNVSDVAPKSRVLVVDNYNDVFTTDGRWTMEILTKTPFGIDRLHYVTFVVDRTLKVNGMLSTIE